MINTKLSNFNFKFYEKSAFLEAILYRDGNNKAQTILYFKSTEQPAFLHAKSKHPRFLKNCLPYSKVLRLKTIGSATTEFERKKF